MGGIEEARYDHMPVPIEDITEEIVLLLRKGESLALVALAALAMGSCWSMAMEATGASSSAWTQRRAAKSLTQGRLGAGAAPELARLAALSASMVSADSMTLAKCMSMARVPVSRFADRQVQKVL